MIKRYPELEGLIKEGFVLFAKRGTDGYSTSVILCEEASDGPLKGQYVVSREARSNKLNVALGGLEYCINPSREVQIPDGTGFMESLIRQGGMLGIAYDKKEGEEDSPSFKVYIHAMNAPTWTIHSILPLCVTLEQIENDDEIVDHYRKYGYDV